MKNRILTIALLSAMLLGIGQVSAQERVVRAIELELGGGIITPTSKLHFDKNHPGWNANLEVRYNFKSLPLDLGLHVDGAALNRELNPIQNIQELREVKFASITTLAVLDVNIWRAKGISLFGGVGVGYGMLINDFQKITHIKDVDKLGCFCVMPRVGIEIIHRVRATLYYKQLKKEQNHFGLNLGVVIGGGKTGFVPEK